MYHQQELTRLQFLIERDGIDGAIAFAKQTLRTYRTHLKRRNKGGHRMGYGLAFRRPLVSSCVVFRRFLRDHAPIN